MENSPLRTCVVDHLEIMPGLMKPLNSKPQCTNEQPQWAVERLNPTTLKDTVQLCACNEMLTQAVAMLSSAVLTTACTLKAFGFVAVLTNGR